MVSKGVGVVGSVIEDHIHRVATLPLPGESVVATEVRVLPGGKGANQAVAARRLGAPTFFLARVGADAAGAAARRDLEASGLELALLVTPEAPTGHAAVIVDETGENLIAVHLGANAHLHPDDLAAVQARLAAAAVLVTQLEVPPEVVRAVASIATASGKTAVLNAAPMRADARELFAGYDIVVLNRSEAEQVAGVGIAGLDDAMAALRAVRDLGVQSPVITLGAGGAVYVDRGRAEHAGAPEVEVVDTTGAGDAFVGALAAFLAEGQMLPDAVSRACRYAARAVGALGARAAYDDRATFEDWERRTLAEPD